MWGGCLQFFEVAHRRQPSLYKRKAPLMCNERRLVSFEVRPSEIKGGLGSLFDIVIVSGSRLLRFGYGGSVAFFGLVR